MKLDLATATTILKDHNVHYVGCYFEGSGDSGAIDHYIFKDADFKDDFEAEDLGYVDSDISLPADVQSEIEHALEDIFYDHLNEVEDWYNNDGGYGTLMMDVSTGKFISQVNCRYTQIESFHHEGKFQAEDA